MKKFTQCGLGLMYGGNNVVVDPSGGIFKHCRLGSTISDHPPEFCKMENAIALTSELRSCSIKYHDGELCTTYARVKLIYDFVDEHIGDVNELILTGLARNDGALYHHKMDSPLKLDGTPFSIEINLEFPIIPYDMVLVKRKNFTAIGKIHEIDGDDLRTILPASVGKIFIDGDVVEHTFGKKHGLTIIGTQPKAFTLKTRIS